jgi:hypothetical protein
MEDRSGRGLGGGWRTALAAAALRRDGFSQDALHVVVQDALPVLVIARG